MHQVDFILAQIPRLHALVIGDICLDRWCTYDPALAEPSRETGIPRTAVVSGVNTPGAGGTVANNLVSLGAGGVSVLGVIGDDGHGWELRRALTAGRIASDRVVISPRIQTFTYTKLLRAADAEEDLPRIDFINTRPLPEPDEQALLAQLPDAVAAHDVILVSDQAETDAGGVVTAAVREALCRLALQYPDKVFWVDSRRRPELYRHCIVKPNEDEAHAALMRLGRDGGYAALREVTASPFLPVTHGSKGVLLIEADGGETWVPAVPVANPVDICGAGDSFSAGAALAYALTQDPVAAARFGNAVASVTIQQKGTGSASPAQVRVAAALLP
jgi:rfaE bifunctional protein kinase chain/domain